MRALLCSLSLVLLTAYARAQGTYRFEGKIVDVNTQKPLVAEVVTYGATPEAMSRLQTSPTGTFTLLTETVGPYRLVVSAPAYQAQELRLTATPGAPNAFTVRLVPLEVGAKVTLNSVRFKQSKAELLPESFAELDRLVAVLNANPTLEIQLNGHTDNQGDPAKNQVLSEQRVQTVITYVTRQGIGAARLRGKGFGGTQPIAPNDREANRQLNRRVEFEILKK